MKKVLATAVLTLGVTGIIPAAAFAYGGPQTNPTTCPDGKQVVNVTYTLTNDADSSYGGYTWATDTLNRHLQIFQTGNNQYCAQLSDNGSFVTTGNGDPDAVPGATLSAGVKGDIHGGYNTGNYASNLTSANYATNGNLGTFDANGSHPSISSYTPGWAGSQPFWAWYYHTPQNGNWTDAYNVSQADSGDIAD